MKDKTDKYLNLIKYNKDCFNVLLDSLIYANYIDDKESFFNISEKTALLSEKITLQLRCLTEKSTNTKRSILLKQQIENLGIDISGDKNCVVIKLPCLLPHKKAKNNNFIINPLLQALQDFTISNKFIKIKDANIWVNYVYDNGLGTKAIRDYDNFELSEILDTIAVYLLIDDSGQYCNLYHTTEISDQTYTEIMIMKKEVFTKKLLKKSI